MRRNHAEIMAFYGQFVRAGDLCFDIGAHLGNRTAAFLDLGASVVAVEPQEECARRLEEAFGRRPGFHLVRKGLDAQEGRREILVANVTTISSMSRAWIDAVVGSGRFAGYTWSAPQWVEVTTLDSLVSGFGVPTFCKIDVEGFELQVLQGLSSPLPALSIEFTPEFLQSTRRCIQHLESLGEYGYNYSVGESMSLTLEPWVTGEELCTQLDALTDRSIFGDVYARRSK